MPSVTPNNPTTPPNPTSQTRLLHLIAHCLRDHQDSSFMLQCPSLLDDWPWVPSSSFDQYGATTVPVRINPLQVPQPNTLINPGTLPPRPAVPRAAGIKLYHPVSLPLAFPHPFTASLWSLWSLNRDQHTVWVGPGTPSYTERPALAGLAAPSDFDPLWCNACIMYVPRVRWTVSGFSSFALMLFRIMTYVIYTCRLCLQLTRLRADAEEKTRGLIPATVRQVSIIWFHIFSFLSSVMKESELQHASPLDRWDVPSTHSCNEWVVWWHGDMGQAMSSTVSARCLGGG